MKQIVMGYFGMLIIMGLLLVEMNIYSVVVGREELRNCMHAIERIVADCNQETEGELKERVELELCARLGDKEAGYKIDELDVEKNNLDLQLSRRISYFGKNNGQLEYSKKMEWTENE